MDKIVFERLLAGVKVSITAERIERLNCYALTIRMDGALYDVRHSDDAWADARAAIEEAFTETEQLSTVAS